MTNLTITRARALLNHAVQRGKMSRPKVCPVCAAKPQPAFGGATKIWARFPEGHENWRVVQWLCNRCYRGARQ
jgi:hypothetical protein